MVALVARVNAAIFIEGSNGAKDDAHYPDGLDGGFIGSAVMALGIALLTAGPRDVVAWLQMLLTGTLPRAAGARQRASTSI